MMHWQKPRTDFYVAEEYFSREVARGYLLEILMLGEDPEKGFHHPDLRPNRFHAAPKYPVDQYMGLGLYWNPVDYLYHQRLPHNGATPWPLPIWLTELCGEILQECFPHHVAHYRPEAAIVNYYTSGRKMGWHVDKEEANHRMPVIGINFGGTARFYFEDEGRQEQSLLIPGNSIYAFGDSARLMRHSVGAAYRNSLSFESVGLLHTGERLNLTVRQVTP